MVAFFCPPPFIAGSKLTFEPVSIGAITTPSNTAVFTADLPVGLIVFLETCTTSGSGGRPLASVDVGGGAGAVVIDAPANANINASISMYENLVAGNKTVTLAHSDGAINGAWVDAYVLKGYQSTAAHDTKLDPTTGTNTSNAVNIDIPAGGIALAVLSKNNNAAATWTGATARDTRNAIKTALHQAEAASPGHAIGVSWSGATGSRLIAASWR